MVYANVLRVVYPLLLSFFALPALAFQPLTQSEHAEVCVKGFGANWAPFSEIAATEKLQTFLAGANITLPLYVCATESDTTVAGSGVYKRGGEHLFVVGFTHEFRKALASEAFDAVLAHEVAHQVARSAECDHASPLRDLEVYAKCEHAVDMKALAWVLKHTMRTALEQSLASLPSILSGKVPESLYTAVMESMKLRLRYLEEISMGDK